jgi:hypothetical protein
MVKSKSHKSLDIGQAKGMTNVECSVSLELLRVIFLPLLSKTEGVSRQYFSIPKPTAVVFPKASIIAYLNPFDWRRYFKIKDIALY